MDWRCFSLGHPVHITTRSCPRLVSVAEPQAFTGFAAAIPPRTLVASTPHRVITAFYPAPDPPTLMIGTEQTVHHHERRHAAWPPARVLVAVDSRAGPPLVVTPVPAAVVAAAEPAHLPAVAHVDSLVAHAVVAAPVRVAEPSLTVAIPAAWSSSRAVLGAARVSCAEGAVGGFALGAAVSPADMVYAKV